MNGQIDEDNWRVVRNRDLYAMMCADFGAPAIERKHGLSFTLSWRNLHNDCLISTSRELIFLIIHNKLLVRERLFHIRQAIDPYCLYCIDQAGAIICDIDHYFCSCTRISRTWATLKSLILTLLDVDEEQVSDSNILRLNIKMDRCMGTIWILGVYVTAVWKATEKDTPLCEAELFGFLKFKFRTAKLGTQEHIEIVERLLGN